MNTYILSIIIAGVALLLAALISVGIQYEGGSHPKDPGKRKLWFWIFAIINPALFYSLAAFVMKPSNKKAANEWMDSLPIAIAIGFVTFVVVGFILSKIFKNGKLGHWF